VPLEEDAGSTSAVVVGATLVVGGAIVAVRVVRVTVRVVRVSVVVTPGRVTERVAAAFPPPPPQAPSSKPATAARAKSGANRISAVRAARRSTVLTAAAFNRDAACDTTPIG
jgi:hypothetical protein